MLFNMKQHCFMRHFLDNIKAIQISDDTDLLKHENQFQGSFESQKRCYLLSVQNQHFSLYFIRLKLSSMFVVDDSVVTFRFDKRMRG